MEERRRGGEEEWRRKVSPGDAGSGNPGRRPGFRLVPFSSC